MNEKEFFHFIRVKYPYNRPKSQWSKNTCKEKIVCISDPHEPFGDETIYNEILKHKDAYTIIICGDYGDFYSKSKFRKTKYHSFQDELNKIFLRTEYLSTHFKNVIIIKGNHDDRPLKYMLDKIDGEVDLLVFMELDLLKRISNYFDNVKIAGTELSEDIVISHIYQHGDIVFTHAEISREQPSAIMDRISRQLHKWRNYLKIKNYNIIAQGHNHIEGKFSLGSEKYFLLPCAANIYSKGFNYIYDPRLRGHPPLTGYSIFYQDNGETDYNRSYNYIINNNKQQKRS